MNNQSILKLKPFVEFFHESGKMFFFKKPGVSIELDDTSGFINSVCNLMDKNLKLEDLKAQIAEEYPFESKYLVDLLKALDNELLLEDISNNNTNLTNYDLERWSRNIEFLGSYCSVNQNKFFLQENLKSLKVVILGLGGVGSNVLYNLAAIGVHNIKAVDFDCVELSNLNRQIIYNTNNLGCLKTDIARKWVKEFLPNSSLDFIDAKLNSVKDIENVIQGYDIVISGVDQPREHIIDWVNLACIKCNIPFICGALDSQWAMFYSVVPGVTGCIECWKVNAKKEGLVFHEIIRKKDFKASNSLNVTVMPFLSILSGLISSEIIKLQTKIAPAKSLGNLCAYDFLTNQISIQEKWERNNNCKVCGNND